jgi:hypothetical protein
MKPVITLLGQILTHELKRGEDKHCWNYFNNNAVPTKYAMLQNVKVCQDSYEM